MMMDPKLGEIFDDDSSWLDISIPILVEEVQ
jgi:hypothetical protein